jgi:crotonobetainyl-CoA:carnitine CoA-transferase CaiB-like acyl-CoA transferase
MGSKSVASCDGLRTAIDSRRRLRKGGRVANLLRGIRVLESAQLFNGDYTGQLLADEGADVIKVESPFRGDYLRDFLGQMKPHTRGHSPLHMILNRNKRSVTVNLRTSEGKEILQRMLVDADVFLDGNSTGALDAIGVGYGAVRAMKPDIVFAAISGLGNKGPYGHVPTHGQSMSALAGAQAYKVDDQGNAVPSEEPGRSIHGPGAWIVGPLYASMAICAALLRRERTGEGAYIDVAASDADISASWMSIVTMLNRDRIGADETGGNGGPKYGVYQTKDEKFVLIALIEHHFFEHFCNAIERADLLEVGVGFKSRNVAVDWGPESLRPTMREIMRSRTQVEWMELAVANDCVIAPANSADDLLDDPHLRAREAIIEYVHPSGGPMHLTGNPIKVEGEHFEIHQPAPSLGEHTDEYLTSLGYTLGELAAWRDADVI